MTIDVDDVSEKLSGLVSLLKIVGIDGVDPNALVEEQKRLTANKKDGSSSGTGTTAQSTDSSQILEIIKKLQQAQADSPEILKALQSPELVALASLAASKNSAPAPAPAPASLEDMMDDEDDNYPKIGPGYSDNISVASDLTTPTVMTKQNVNEEEYYSDTNGGPGNMPPMSIGGGSKAPNSEGGAGRGKSRNILSSVSAAASQRAALKGGGAAAQRRANHQSTMAKLQEPEDTKSPKSRKGKDKKSSDRKKKKKSGDHDEKSKSSKGSNSKGDEIDWGTNGDDSSFDKFDTTFGEDPFGNGTGNTKTVVDSDGFFTSDAFANVDPFAQQTSAATRRASTPSSSKNGTPSSSKTGKKKKPRKPKDDEQGCRNRSDKPKEKRGSRRRRVSMGD